MTQKQSDYKVEQSSFTLIALFSLKIGRCRGRNWLNGNQALTISMRGKRATGKIQRNNYHHGSCGPSLTGKTSSVSLIFTHGTHRNVKNR